jgi:hypothetical protein
MDHRVHDQLDRRARARAAHRENRGGDDVEDRSCGRERGHITSGHHRQTTALDDRDASRDRCVEKGRTTGSDLRREQPDRGRIDRARIADDRARGQAIDDAAIATVRREDGRVVSQ